MSVGRPPKPDSERLASTLRVRLTAADRAMIDQVAQGRGEEVSEWARGVLLAAAKREARRSGPAGNRTR